MTEKLKVTTVSRDELSEEVLRRMQAQSALQESEQRWATTLSSIGDAVIATDVTGTITFMNTVAEELTGWTLPEASMKPVTKVFNIINEYTRSEVESPVVKVLREGMVVGLANHTILVKKDGTEVPIDDSGAPIRDKDGSTTGVVLVFRDITERKRAEERTMHLASFPELNPSPVMEVDASGTIIFCNPATQGILKDIGLGDEDCDGLLPEDLKTILQTWDKQNESTLYREVSLKDRVFGETIHLVPQFNVARIYAYDITERKHAEEAAHESERQMTRAQEMAHLGSWELDLASNRLSWSDEVYRIFGLRPQEFGATYDAFLEAIHPEDRAAVDAAYSGSLREGKDTYEIEHRVVRRSSGEVRIVHERCEHLRDDSGRIVKSIGMVHDVTERKKAEDALKKAFDELELRVRERTAELRQAYERLTVESREREQIEAQLRQAQKMEALGTLSGGIAHDFNNILAAIIGFTELIRDRLPKEGQETRHIKRVLEAGFRGRDLVRQMLAFSRKSEQEKKPLQLNDVVQEAIKLLRASIPSTVSVRVKTDNGSDLVLADPTQMQQVLMNLCVNAAHAMQEKGGILDVELSAVSISGDENTDGMKPGPYVKLIVRDTGTGISPDIIDKIFDPFFTTKKLGEGTGLGLSVVHGIVKQHDGYIAVISEHGKGSTFTVYLPQIAGEPETDPAEDDEIPTGSERILFIDDEEALVEMGQDILAELGYEVTSRTSSTVALTLLKSDPSHFDLVITDQTMPEMTGVELAKEVLALRPDMPIIMCTGFSYVVDADKAKAAGIKAFAMKPLTKKEIGRTIRKVLDE